MRLAPSQKFKNVGASVWKNAEKTIPLPVPNINKNTSAYSPSPPPSSVPIGSGEVALASGMFKLGRGGGEGSGTWSFPFRPLVLSAAPPPHNGGRVPIHASTGVGRGHPGGSSAVTSAPSLEDTFFLETGGGPSNFAAITAYSRPG